MTTSPSSGNLPSHHRRWSDAQSIRLPDSHACPLARHVCGEPKPVADSGCGKCSNTCPVNAIELLDFGSSELVDENEKPEALTNAKKKMRPRSKVIEELCLGCGLCAAVCPKKALNMERRTQRVITPINSVHKTVMMAIERGKLQNLIFDNQALYHHRAMAAILGAILKLPPIKQALASRQLKSVYLDALIDKGRKIIPFC